MNNEGDLEAALAALALQDRPNYAKTAREFKVKRLTLWRRHQGLCRSIDEAHEFQRILSNEQTEVLIERIDKLSSKGIPPTPAMVRVFAWEISQNWPGKNWVARFVHTYKNRLKSAYLNGFEIRRKKADNYGLIKKYFEIVSSLKIFVFYANNLIGCRQN